MQNGYDTRNAIQIKIETYWNVNKHWFKGFLDSDAIKIETYWNVNLFTNAFQGVATD